MLHVTDRVWIPQNKKNRDDSLFAALREVWRCALHLSACPFFEVKSGRIHEIGRMQCSVTHCSWESRLGRGIMLKLIHP